MSSGVESQIEIIQRGHHILTPILVHSFKKHNTIIAKKCDLVTITNHSKY